MIEAMLSRAAAFTEETGDVIFLYDPVTNTDLSGRGAVTTLSGGAVADTNILINGQPTLNFPTVSAKQVVVFPADLNLAIGNWTLEWSFINNIAPAAYANEFMMYSRTGGFGVGVYTRFGDSGFGNRWNLSDPRGAGDPNLTQPLPYSKAMLVGLTTNVAMVSIAGLIKVYVNGVVQTMALGAGSGTYNRATFAAQGMDKIYQFVMGDANGSSVRAVPGNRGRIRLSNFARYTRNYTPGPLVL